MSDRVGQQLGNYRLIRLLGYGGFAEVYLGEHVYLKNLAAIKVLYTRLSKDDLESFLVEGRTLVNLIHPHIVRVLEFGVECDIPYLVMDYALNGSLRQRYDKASILPLPLIIGYVRQVADALQYAHNEKVIHRDVKPANMLLGRQNELLLSDFGTAVAAQIAQIYLSHFTCKPSLRMLCFTYI
jgi:serine/threonine protein kinase